MTRPAIEHQAERVREAAQELLVEIQGAGSAEELAEAVVPLSDAMAALDRALTDIASWYERHADDLYPLDATPAESAAGAAADAAREVRRAAAHLRSVGTHLLLAIEPLEHVGSRMAHRVSAEQAASLAARGCSLFVVRHVSYSQALSWDVGHSTDAAVADFDARRLALMLPIGDVAEVAAFRPQEQLPGPALRTYPGQAERSSAPG